MQYRSLGESGIEASVVGFGAWAVGGWYWGGADEQTSIRAIQAGIDVGMNLIDTAPIYGYGASEEVVGKAISGRRDKVVLATKCGIVWDGREGSLHFYGDEKGKVTYADQAKYIVKRCLRPESIQAEVESSLQRLKTDHIDLLQTHWQDPDTPLGQAMECLVKLKEQGKIRAIGVSNVNVDHLEQYRAVVMVASAQERFSMLDRRIEAELLPYCIEHGLAMLAYSPLEQGLLTGKVGPDRKFNDGDMRNKSENFSIENRRKVAALLAELQPIADEHGITPAQLAIAWTIAQRGVTHALCGARSTEQALENAHAADVALSQDELQRMNEMIEQHIWQK